MNSPSLLFKSGTFVNFVRQIGRHLQRKAKVAEVPHTLPSAGTFSPSIIEINGSLRAEMQSSGWLSVNSWRFLFFLVRVEVILSLFDRNGVMRRVVGDKLRHKR